MKDIDKFIKRMMLTDCNNKIREFNEICNWITEYSNANIFLIPSKYKETIENELKDLINKNHALIYNFQETEDKDMLTLTLFNFGVIHRENVLKEMEKCKKK